MEVEFELNGVFERRRIDKEIFFVGRAAGNDLRIQDGTVSSKHAKIMDGPEQAAFEDLGSTNGTRMTSPKADLVKEGVLRPGDVIVFGRIPVKILSVGSTGGGAGGGGGGESADAQVPQLDIPAGEQTMRMTRDRSGGAAGAAPAPVIGEDTAPSGLMLPMDADLSGAATGNVLIQPARLAALARMVPRLVGAKRLTDACDRLLAIVMELLQAQIVEVFIADPKSGAMTRAAALQADGTPLPPADAEQLMFASQLLSDGKAVLAQPPTTPGEPRDLHAPMLVGDKRVGLITAWVARKTGGGDLRALALLANQAAVVIEGIRYLEELKRTYEELSADYDDLEKEAAKGGGGGGGGAAGGASPELASLLDEIVRELKMPIPAVQNMVGKALKELERGGGPMQVTPILSPAQHAAAHLGLILNDITELADLQAGRVQLEATLIDANGIAAEVHHFEGRGATQKGCKFTLEAPKEAVQLAADPRRIVQMLHHIVVTAIKLAPPNSEIKLSVIPEESDLKFVIHDAAPPDRHGGPGIVIARRLAALHGAALQVTGDATKGTDVTFALPLPLESDEEEEEEEEEEAAVGSETIDEPPPASAG